MTKLFVDEPILIFVDETMTTTKIKRETKTISSSSKSANVCRLYSVSMSNERPEIYVIRAMPVCLQHSM